MGRNKFSQQEITEIARLLKLKNASKRGRQKEIRHELRVDYEFNISDFNVQGKAFGPDELQEAIRRGAIVILDEATIAQMKAKHARDRARDEAARCARSSRLGRGHRLAAGSGRMGSPRRRRQRGVKKKANPLAIPNKIPIFAL